MFKKFFALLTLSVLIVLASVSLTSYTEASTSEPSDVETLATNVYGPYSFTTRDVSGTAILSSHKEGVMSLLHYQDLSHYGAASVRLCNMDSGNCTGFGALSAPPVQTRTFTNVLPGRYYGDVVIGSARVSGKITFTVRY